jgi:hypothetical protein
MFAEPLRDGWAYFLTIINLLLAQANVFRLSESCRRMLVTMKDNLSQRMARSEDQEFLATLEDKHIFALDDLYDIASREGLEFIHKKPERTALQSIILQFNASGIPSSDMEKIEPFLKEIIPDVSGKDVEFAGFFNWLAFRKLK